MFGVYDLSSNYLVIHDEDTQKTIVMCAESGGKPFGDPIPEGIFEIFERNGRDEFYRLDPIDFVPRNDTHDPTDRTKFRLHKPGRTVGCVAVKEECQECWQNLLHMMANTRAINTNVTSHRRFESIRGPANETVKKY